MLSLLLLYWSYTDYENPNVDAVCENEKKRKQNKEKASENEEKNNWWGFFSEEYVFCLEEDGRGLGSRVSLELLLLEVLILSWVWVCG